MKAYVIERAGGPDVLQLRDIPTVAPKDDEVRIRVRAFGLNRAEADLRAGRMGPVVGTHVPGIEAVGEIAEDPSGRFRIGQRVATVMGGLQFTRPGSYAEEVTVLRTNVLDLDGNFLQWAELAALPHAYLTSWGALNRSLGIEPGQTLLVRGATSAIGLAAVTYAKAWGLQVLATTRSAERIKHLHRAGADDVFIDAGSVAEEVLRVYPDGIDAVLEIVGVSTLRDSARTLRPFGSVTVIGLLGGPPMLKRLDLVADLPPAVRLSFFPSELLGTAALPLMHSPLSAIADDIAAKRMRSHLQHTFEFDDVREAHRWIESGRAPGKLVVRV